MTHIAFRSDISAETYAAEPTRKGIVFIDTGVADQEALADVPAQITIRF